MKSFQATLSLLSFFLFILSLYTALANIIVQPGAKVTEFTHKKSSLGVVKGVRPCGGQGKLLEWRYETCLDSDPICVVPADGVSRSSQLDFIPINDIKKLGARFTVRSSDGKINDVVDEGSTYLETLKHGSAYTFTAVGGVTNQLKGKDAVFQYILYDVSDNRVEVCAEADIIYV